MGLYKVDPAYDFKNNGWTTSPVAGQGIQSVTKKTTLQPTVPALTPFAQDASTSHSMGCQFAQFDPLPGEVVTNVTLRVYCTSGTVSSGQSLQLVIQNTRVAGTQASILIGPSITAWQAVNQTTMAGFATSDIGDGNIQATAISLGTNTGTNKVYEWYLEITTVGGRIPKVIGQARNRAATR